MDYQPLFGVVGGAVVLGIAALVSTSKTGLVPDEDTGTLFVTISASPGKKPGMYKTNCCTS